MNKRNLRTSIKRAAGRERGTKKGCFAYYKRT